VRISDGTVLEAFEEESRETEASLEKALRSVVVDRLEKLGKNV
jgi:hypothetical protein